MSHPLDWTAAEDPPYCANGHRLGPRRVLVGFEPCTCTPTVGGGHRLWHCRTCGAVACWPPHDPNYVPYPTAGDPRFRHGQ